MDQEKIKQSDLLFDYIKFHLGLYLATPTVMVIVATSLDLQKCAYFQYGLLGMIGLYFLAGAHASWFIASYINIKWSEDKNWTHFGEQANQLGRRIIHHYIYWLGLVVALCSLIAAWLQI